MSLREAVEANHRAAEQTALARSMIDGTMDVKHYHEYLFNMREIYSAIEKKLPFLPNDVQRTQKYNDDLKALGRGSGTIARSTAEYVSYLSGLDIPSVWAHVYVHYLGNMYGGQLLKKHFTWKCSHLEFENVKSSIAYIRSNIADVDPKEANAAFKWTIKVYNELHDPSDQIPPELTNT